MLNLLGQNWSPGWPVVLIVSMLIILPFSYLHFGAGISLCLCRSLHVLLTHNFQLIALLISLIFLTNIQDKTSEMKQ